MSCLRDRPRASDCAYRKKDQMPSGKFTMPCCGRRGRGHFVYASITTNHISWSECDSPPLFGSEVVLAVPASGAIEWAGP
jgi:hypothetical protein